jgi:hypothetical protein
MPVLSFATSLQLDARTGNPIGRVQAGTCLNRTDDNIQIRRFILVFDRNVETMTQPV